MTDLEKAIYFINHNEIDKAILCYKKCARDGNVEAMNNLASIYWQVKHDYPNTCYWYKQAMDKGSRIAFNSLALVYQENGEYNKAIKLFSALSKYEPKAYLNIGLIYETCLNDFENALSAYQNAYDKGIDEAGYAMGLLYQKQGNISEAKMCFEKAALKGHVNSMVALGNIYYGSSKSHNIDKAEKVYKEAAEKGSSEALVALGRIYKYDKGDYVASFKFFEDAANSGDVIAMDEIGHMYEEIFDTPQMALKWYKKAVAIDYIPSMVSLGYFYFNQPEFYDFDLSRGWFTKAYHAGSIDGLVGLGYIYFYDFSNNNTVKALDYLELAGKKGNPNAYKIMGDIYSTNYNFINFSQALDCYEKALSLDNHGDICFLIAKLCIVLGNQGKFLEMIDKACQRDNAEALLYYGKLLCDSAFVRYDYVNGVHHIEKASDLGLPEASKFLSDLFKDKKHQMYDLDKSNFYYRQMIKQLVIESQKFDTPPAIDDLTDKDLISCTIALIERINKKSL